jgi:hypothetical protein
MPSACHALLLACGCRATVLPRLLLMFSFLPLFLPSKQKYYNVRADYIAAFYDVINWKGVSDLYAAALQVRSSMMVQSVLLRLLPAHIFTHICIAVPQTKGQLAAASCLASVLKHSCIHACRMLQGADSYDELDVLTPAANWQ